MYKVKISESFETMSCFIYFYTEEGGVVHILEADGHTMRKLDPNNAQIHNFNKFVIPQKFLSPLMDALREMGVKPKDQSFTEGELKAQTNHLKDLRRLLKLPE
ncbi:MAG: hypothetical protein WC980_10745 [Candidatus Brocadiia bacterium]